MATAEELKKKFQQVVQGAEPSAPDRIIKAWEVFAEFQEQNRFERDIRWQGGDPYVHAIIEALTHRTYLDPTTTQVGAFAFRLHTDGEMPVNRGEIPDLLEGLEEPEYSASSLFCRMMVIAAYNPRELDAQFPV